MSIFERKDLPLTAAPLYYLALADLTEKHWARLWPRLKKEEAEARAYLDLFRGEAVAFQGVIVRHIDQQAKSRLATQERKRAVKDGASWIGLVRRSGGVVIQRIVDAETGAGLKSTLHIGRELDRGSAGQVLFELRYLAAVLPGLEAQLSPPLHSDELGRGATLAAALELKLFGKVNATAEQTQASVAKGAAWEVLEQKSKHLLDLARLEFSKDPAHPDYKIRIEFEGLDERFVPQEKKPAEPETK